MLTAFPGLLEHLRKRGVPVIFWVINERKDFERSLSYKGCVGIMTDMPGSLSDYLKEKGEYVDMS